MKCTNTRMGLNELDRGRGKGGNGDRKTHEQSSKLGQTHTNNHREIHIEVVPTRK